jgi:ArsR family transcriptional regulator
MPAITTPGAHTVQQPVSRACCGTTCRQEVARTRFDDDHLAGQERVLDALADPTRLRIVHLLARHEALCVCEIEAAFNLGQPTISHHLRILRDAGLAHVERRGTWAYYSLARPAVKELVGDLLALV